jgi:hypothetical protein
VRRGWGRVNLEGRSGRQRRKADPCKESEDDSRKAEAIRIAATQAGVGIRRVTARKSTPTFTGDLAVDFAGAEIIEYRKQDEAALRSAVAWDERCLYLAWEVRDRSPWQNGAGLPEFLYAKGDTVNFQVATDPDVAPERVEPVLSDLRLSVGDFKGTPTAVIYRKVAREMHPKVFSSGIVPEYRLDSVRVAPEARIEVKRRGDAYLVELAIPLATLGLKPEDGLTLRADFGVTHGDPGGRDTVLRSYWSNQDTGIVNDEVFELEMEPKNWGELRFRP